MVNIDCGRIDNLTKQLIGSSLMADLITHFNNPENQKKFEEWQRRRENAEKYKKTPADAGTSDRGNEEHLHLYYTAKMPYCQGGNENV